MKYWKDVFKALRRTLEAGYDEQTRHQRADETMGLALLEETIARDMFFQIFCPTSGWEFEVTCQLGLQASRLLFSAGWDKKRVDRKIQQLRDEIMEGEETSKSS